MKAFLADLSLVNDAVERCSKDVTEYAEMTPDSARREDILLVVNHHRWVFQELRKEALAQLP
jgi:predicted PilT family ATPase